MLKFLVDESSGKKLYSFLKSNNLDILFVGDLFPESLDSYILEFAEKEKRILITNDKDFGELIFRLGKPTIGVIFLRLKKDTPENKQKHVLNVITNFYNKLENSFIIVTEDKIRIRSLK